MAITTPFLSRSRITTAAQAVMPFLRAVSQITLVYCVMDAARAAFYPHLPRHSPELTLWQFPTALTGWLLVKAAQWRKSGASE